MSKTTNRRAGFGVIGIVVVIAAVALVSGAGFVVYRKSKTDASTAVTPAPATTKQPTSPMTEQPEQPAQPVDDRKTYANDKYGLSFKYPKELSVREIDLSTMNEEGLELYLQVVGTGYASEPEVAGLTVSRRDFQAETAKMDGSIHDRTDKQYRVNSNLKGKQAAKYTIPQAPGVDRIIYYFAVGNKTYSIQTLNEEVNVKRNSNYVADFNKMVDSLKLP